MSYTLKKFIEKHVTVRRICSPSANNMIKLAYASADILNIPCISLSWSNEKATGNHIGRPDVFCDHYHNINSRYPYEATPMTPEDEAILGKNQAYIYEFDKKYREMSLYMLLYSNRHTDVILSDEYEYRKLKCRQLVAHFREDVIITVDNAHQYANDLTWRLE